MTEPGLQPNSVFVLEHDDRYYDMGERFVRGIYHTREQAEADVVLKQGGPEWWSLVQHNYSCCGVEEWEVGKDILRENA